MSQPPMFLSLSGQRAKYTVFGAVENRDLEPDRPRFKYLFYRLVGWKPWTNNLFNFNFSDLKERNNHLPPLPRSPVLSFTLKRCMQVALYSASRGR